MTSKHVLLMPSSQWASTSHSTSSAVLLRHTARQVQVRAAVVGGAAEDAGRVHLEVHALDGHPARAVGVARARVVAQPRLVHVARVGEVAEAVRVRLARVLAGVLALAAVGVAGGAPQLAIERAAALVLENDDATVDV